VPWRSTTQQDKPPPFIDLATLGASAEACANYLAEVRAIAATGRLVYPRVRSRGGHPPVKAPGQRTRSLRRRRPDEQPTNNEGPADDEENAF
jgi:hypothetical protein